MTILAPAGVVIFVAAGKIFVSQFSVDSGLLFAVLTDKIALHWEIIMEKTELLVHQSQMEIAGHHYEVCVYARNDGLHFAKTTLSPQDIVINDGLSLAHVLEKHRNLLPLAIASRQMRAEQSSLDQ
ncbi:MAG: hypothetical protein U1D97_04705 [Desulfuromonadales bacterium]|nr:hypothetical protein [Desulfuromonadales bacterium]